MWHANAKYKYKKQTKPFAKRVKARYVCASEQVWCGVRCGVWCVFGAVGAVGVVGAVGAQGCFVR